MVSIYRPSQATQLCKGSPNEIPPQPGGFSNRNVSSFSLEASCWDGDPTALISSATSPLGLEGDTFSCCLHMAFLPPMCLTSSLLMRTPIILEGAPPIGSHFNLIISLKILSPNADTFIEPEKLYL